MLSLLDMNYSSTPKEFIHLIVDFGEYGKQKYLPRTISQYTTHLRKFASQNDVVELNDRSIDTYIASLLRQGRKESSVNNFLNAMRSFVKFLNSEKGLSINLYLPFNLYKKSSTLALFINLYDYEKIVEEIYYTAQISESKNYYTRMLRDLSLVQLLIETGLKTDEVRQLTIDNFNLNSRQLIVQEKNRPDRKIRLLDGTIHMIKKFLKERDSKQRKRKQNRLKEWNKKEEKLRLKKYDEINITLK
jgi:site-specific recombinase XerD